MENLILKRGAVVKALRDVQTDTGLLYSGQVYAVKALPFGLGIETLDGTVYLTDLDGTLTDATLDVALTGLSALPQGLKA